VNIKDILKEHGYEIVTNIDMKFLKLKFTGEELERKQKDGILYDYDTTGTYNVRVAEVGFNGYGNLYIVLDSLGDEHFEEGDCFDVIEYEGGEDDVESSL